MNIFIILATILFIVLVGIFIFLNKKSTDNIKQNSFKFSCLTDKDCDTDKKCIYNPEINTNSCISKNKKYCDLSKASDMVTCDPVNNDSDCSVCINGTEFGPGGLRLSCVTLTEDNKNKFYKNIKDIDSASGSYCLPKMTEGEKCNIYTSDTVLTRDTDGSFQWKCVCKPENRIFQTDPKSGDCTLLTGCNNATYPLYVKKPINELGTEFQKCTKDSDCNKDDPNDVCWDQYGNNFGDKPNETGYCYTQWNPNLPINPITSGICKCGSGKYQYKTKDAAGNNIYECLGDKCQKNISDQDIGKTIVIGENSKQCKCNTGYISCPEDIPSEGVSTDIQNIKLLCKDVPQCIPDPCINKFCSNGTTCSKDSECNDPYSRCINGKCSDTTSSCINDVQCGSGKICHNDSSKFDNGNCTCEPGFINIENEYSYVGHSCKDLCSENPCGDRGICYINNGEAKCRNCKSPYGQDSDGKCTKVLKVRGDSCENDVQCYSNKCVTTSIGVYFQDKICS
jgi:hypothetical protein